MDAKRHAACVEEYRTRWLPRYQALARTLEAVLVEAARLHAPLGMVQVRAKGVSSFAEKIIRKPYGDPFLELTDLCGGRVITVTAEHVRAVSDFIKASFEVDYGNSLDVGQRLGTREFGYRSVHYIVQFRPGKCLGVPVPKEALPSKGAPMKAEIQVRTVIQHAWAAVVHDRIYKSSIRVPEALRRDAARLAALLEEADGVVSHVVDDIDAYVVDIGAHMPRGKVLEELDRLDVVLRGEKDAGMREELAVRAAKLCRALADWPALEDRLRPFVRTTQNADLLREYGNALCQRHADRPGGRDYLSGQAALARALELSPDAPDIHAMLAESCERQPRAAARAREHFRHAHQMAPANPYHFTAHLEHELLRDPSGSLVPVLEPAIRRAVNTCARHVQVGIELPRAYMTMGKLHLFLGETYASLDACAKGLRMALDPSSGVCSACLGRELDVLCRLDTAREGLAGDPGAQGTLLESLRRMLLAGLWLATGQHRHLAALKSLRLAGLDPGQRVLILAGACSPAHEADMRACLPLFTAALADFDGTLIGGGTTAGISGIVGALSEMPGRRFTTLGYHPERMATEIRPDTRYDRLAPTPQPDFGPLDAVQAWIDILSAGISPERVTVIGVNGGDIAGFECRLGMALGAAVGVIAGSGRAADRLLADEAWETLARPLALVRDPMTLRAFASSGGTFPTGKTLEALARKIHAAYCGADPGTLNPRILRENGLPWESLPATFKNANLAQAAQIGGILETEGYTLIAAGRGARADNSAVAFTRDELERMAEKEHGRWNMERLRDGWRPGARDDASKTHDCLVPWDVLPETIRQYDRDAVSSWPRLLEEAGITVQKRG